MDIIREYIDTYPDDEPVIIKRYAAKIWLMYLEEIDIPADHISIDVTSDEREDVVINRWRSLLRGWDETDDYQYTVFTNGDEVIRISVDEYGYSHDMINGVLVQTIDSLIEYYNDRLLYVETDLECNEFDSNTKAGLTNKVSRAREILALLTPLGEDE